MQAEEEKQEGRGHVDDSRRETERHLKGRQAVRQKEAKEREERADNERSCSEEDSGSGANACAVPLNYQCESHLIPPF